MAHRVLSPARSCLVAACLGLGIFPGTALAQAHSAVMVQNVVQLSASATVDVLPDLTTIVLNVTREGADAATVQAQVKAALDSALSEARKAVEKGRLDVRTGSFGIYPRHGRDGKISGWQGQAELVLEGRDGPAIAALAGKLGGLSVVSIQHGLSRDLRRQAETEAQTSAINRFKSRAEDVSRAFGFSGYGLRELQVSGQEPAPYPRLRTMAMAAAAPMAEAAVPIEAGRIAVTVTVSGTVQMR